MTETENTNNGEEDVDLYGTLNVDKHASREEIKSRYLHFARLLHPDKLNSYNSNTSNQALGSASPQNQLDPLSRESELALFRRINYAYQILSDDARRKIYDDYGFEGLKALKTVTAIESEQSVPSSLRSLYSKESFMDGTETNSKKKTLNSGTVGHYDKLGENIRDKVLGRIVLERELRDQDSFSAKGVVQAQVDLSNVSENLANASLKHLQVVQSVEFPFAEKHNIKLSVTCFARHIKSNPTGLASPFFYGMQSSISGNKTNSGRDVGIGSIEVTHIYNYSPDTSVETAVSTTSRSDYGLEATVNRKIDEDTKATINFSVQGYETGLEISAERKLTDDIDMAVKIGQGFSEGVSLVFSRNRNFTSATSLRHKHLMRRLSSVKANPIYKPILDDISPPVLDSLQEDLVRAARSTQF